MKVLTAASAIQSTLGVEKGYANDTTDRGGETYAGISRKYHPNWSGWSVIDDLKKAPGFPKTLNTYAGLQDSVVAFYKAEYWDKINADALPRLLGAEVFDAAVNSGISTAIKFLQKSLNILNRNGVSWKDISEDGKIGPNTLAAVTSCIADDRDASLLLTTYRVIRGSFYIDIMRSDTTQERFARGWLKRLNLVSQSRI